MSRITSRTTLMRRVVAVVAVAAAGTGSLGLGASPASAADGVNARTLQALCQSGGGEFRTGRFGELRCYGAALDGMGVFWAERSVCEKSAGRLFVESVVDEATGTGAWVCAPTSI
jgi:hypothetical protein